jgi:hypothetical protein
MSVFGSNHQTEPLHRTAGTIGGSSAESVLGPEDTWISGLEDLDLSFGYQCRQSGEINNGCFPGYSGLTEEGVTVVYWLDRVPDAGNGDTLILESTATSPSATISFEGNLPQSELTASVDGSVLLFHVEVPFGGVTPSGTAQCQVNVCIDPLDTINPGELDHYFLKIDVSEPTFSLSTGDGRGFIKNTTAEEWWLFTNSETASVPGDPGSGNVPPIWISVADSPSGSRLVDSASDFSRDGSSEPNFNLQEGEHTETENFLEYKYDYEGGGSATHFSDGEAVNFGLSFEDLAGNSVGGDLWVIMDITPPEVLLDHSTLEQLEGESPPAVPGETLRVNARVRDIGADNVHTPPQFLKVEARLLALNVENQVTRNSDWFKLEFDQAVAGGDHGQFKGDIPIPSQWDSGNTTAEIRVTDVVGNTNVVNNSGTRLESNISVKADIPRITSLAPLGATEHTKYSAEEDIEFRIRAWDPAHKGDWTEPDEDAGTAIDFDSVRLYYRVGINGTLQNQTMDATTTADTFATTLSFGELDPVYYYFSVKDIAGSEVRYPGQGDPGETIGNQRHLLLHTDRVGPEIEPAFDLSYIGGAGDHLIAFNVTDDPGVGVDETTVVMHWRLGGETALETLNLTLDEITDPYSGETITAFTGMIPQQEEDGAIIEYYVVADDLLGNTGTLGSESALEATELDLSPPTVTVTAPSTSGENRFNVTWEGEDEQSGVRDYTLQFRIGDGRWLSVPTRTHTTLTSWEVCAATDVIYEFRVSARDRVGNERPFPELADASTQVTATDSCVEPPTLVLNAPADGATLTGTTEIRWNAVSSVFGQDLEVQIRVGQVTIADGLESDGSYTWNTAQYNPDLRDPLCFEDGSWPLQVVALDPAGMEGIQEVTVNLNNDRDSCEPTPATTGGGFDLFEDFNPLYLLVVLAFIGLMAVFAVGMARRW